MAARRDRPLPVTVDRRRPVAALAPALGDAHGLDRQAPARERQRRREAEAQARPLVDERDGAERLERAAAREVAAADQLRIRRGAARSLELVVAIGRRAGEEREVALDREPKRLR